MLFSFVVPVYNIEKYVAKCIESLLAQECDRMEIILVDDGSKDGSGRICDEYAEKDSRIKVIHQNNAGVAVARNAGIEQACGQWVCLVDGDDYVEPSLCTLLEKRLDSKYDIIFFGYQHIMPKNTEIFRNSEKEKKLAEEDFRKLQLGIFNSRAIGDSYKNIPYLTPWGKLWNREFILKNKLLYTPGVKKGQDGLFNIRAFGFAKSGLYVDDILYSYRINADSVCHRYNPEIESYLDTLIGRYSEFLETHPDEGLIKNFSIMKLRQFMYCIILDFCHPDNKNGYKLRRKAFLELRRSDTYANLFEHVSLKDLKFQEKVLAVLIKGNCFWGIDILNKMRNKL